MSSKIVNILCIVGAVLAAAGSVYTDNIHACVAWSCCAMANASVFLVNKKSGR